MIDDDILNIGSSKWNQQFQSLGGGFGHDMTSSGFGPSHFMLPASENVRVFSSQSLVITLIDSYWWVLNSKAC